MTAAAIVRAAATTLKNAAAEAPGDEARLLAGAAWGLDGAGLIARSDVQPPRSAVRRLDDMTAAKAAGRATSRITGHGGFWSFGCPPTPATLDPRADSECVVVAAVDRIAGDQRQRVLDLGCGTGCLLAAALLMRPGARGLAIDRSPMAIRYATNLFRALGLSDRTDTHLADAAAFVDGGFDVVIANPPYLTRADVAAAPVAVRCGDPHGALDGGPDGLAAHRIFAGAIKRAVRPGGAAVIEIGATQADAAIAIFERAGLRCEAVIQDGAGRDRAIALRRAR